MYQVAIVDDDPIQLEHTAKLVKTLLPDDLCCVHCFQSVEQFNLAAEIVWQIAVLDIELGGKENGVDVARHLQQRSPSCQIIFLTSHTEYISEVYEVPHLYLALKSKMQQYLPRAIALAMEHLKTEEEAVFWLGNGSLKKRLPQREILVFERCQRVTFVCTVQDTFRTPTSLTQIEPLVDEMLFVRCHQSFLVNMDHVAQHALDSFVLINGKVVPISRQYQQAVRNKFLQHIAQCVQI